MGVLPFWLPAGMRLVSCSAWYVEHTVGKGMVVRTSHCGGLVIALNHALGLLLVFSCPPLQLPFVVAFVAGPGFALYEMTSVFAFASRLFVLSGLFLCSAPRAFLPTLQWELVRPIIIASCMPCIL